MSDVRDEAATLRSAVAAATGAAQAATGAAPAAPTLVCAGCGTVVPAGRPFTPACPARTPGDDIDHVLVARLDRAAAAPPDDDPNPFVR